MGLPGARLGASGQRRDADPHPGGRNPVPARTTSPFFAPIGEQHVTFGARWAVQTGWELSGTVELPRAKTVSYDNPGLPLGAGASERSAYRALHLMLGRRWRA